METQSLPSSEICMNNLPEKGTPGFPLNTEKYPSNHPSIIVPTPSDSDTGSMPTNTKISDLTASTVTELSNRLTEIFAKLQRNLEHNTRIFQEKSQNLLGKIDQAEGQLRRVLAQLEPGNEKSAAASVGESLAVIGATESIALSEETKIEADETTDL